MLRHDRIGSTRRHGTDYSTLLVDDATDTEIDYPHRLNLYTIPPRAEITLEEFEQWAIDRLRILAELEACSFRNKTPQETTEHMKSLFEKYLPLESNSAIPTASTGSEQPSAEEIREKRQSERQKDHFSHFILRLAFSTTEDLRRRFSRVESMLFRLRFTTENARERNAFMQSLDMDWEPLTETELNEYQEDLAAMADVGARKTGEAGSGLDSAPAPGPGSTLEPTEEEIWFKLDWERVPELVESRRVFLRDGKAFVPSRQQATMLFSEFSTHLDQELELTARALPRLDESDRLTPILNHLEKSFVTPDASYSTNGSALPDSEISASSIDTLSVHFPLCKQHLHRSLRRDAHLKHYGRLQYTLFLKGIGLSLDECLIFWRSAFNKINDDTFNKEYRYNVRHVYGDVGGDSNRRGGGYSPYSCQKILTENAPGPAEAHGCPYRHFNLENLTSLLESVGISDRSVLQGVKEDKDAQKFHMACNRYVPALIRYPFKLHVAQTFGAMDLGSNIRSVFEHVHKTEIKRAKDGGIMNSAQLETIVHPNEYFKRSYTLKSLGQVSVKSEDIKMEE